MENKINVAVFSDSFYPIIGGRENVIDNLMRELSKNANAFLLTTRIKGWSQEQDNLLPYEIHRCKSLRVTKNEYLSIIDKETKRMILNKIKDGKIDIIHVHTKFALAKYALKLGKKYGIPVITTCHTNYLSQYKNQLKCPIIYKPLLHHVKKIMNKMNHVFTVSNYMKGILKKLGIKNNISVIPNGSDMINYKPSEAEKNALIKTYNLENVKNTFIFVGRITETKNLTFLFNSLSLIKKQGTHFKMLIVGGGDINKYKSLCKTLNIGDDCIFTGPIRERKTLANLYNLSTLNLYPSTGESFGLTIREAGMQGTPSVTIDNCATSEDIVHNKNGYISINSVEAFSNTIISAINNSNLMSVSESAKNTFNITWQDVANKLIATYDNIINKIPTTN